MLLSEERERASTILRTAPRTDLALGNLAQPETEHKGGSPWYQVWILDGGRRGLGTMPVLFPSTRYLSLFFPKSELRSKLRENCPRLARAGRELEAISALLGQLARSRPQMR